MSGHVVPRNDVSHTSVSARGRSMGWLGVLGRDEAIAKARRSAEEQIASGQRWLAALESEAIQVHVFRVSASGRWTWEEAS